MRELPWIIMPWIWFCMGLFRSAWKTGHWSWDTMDQRALIESLLFMAVGIFFFLHLIYQELKSLKKE